MTDDGLDAPTLLDWFERHGRDLPWRQTREPWEILVVEVMAQQTQIDRVVARWRRFLRRFPTPTACAAASLADVLHEWAGLGYNRRARQLHETARRVVAEHGGALPRQLDALLSLPGVGPYTARAVSAFAFEVDVGVVDTNTARVLARTAGRTLKASEVQRRADRLTPTGRGWSWNQAMLDLGATVCVARSPKCECCPLRPTCVWRRSGPDPAFGTAGTGGRQSRFNGSDRQGRGRLLDALRRAPVGDADLAVAMGWPTDGERARRVASGVVGDGLAQRVGDEFRLPG